MPAFIEAGVRWLWLKWSHPSCDCYAHWDKMGQERLSLSLCVCARAPISLFIVEDVASFKSGVFRGLWVNSLNAWLQELICKMRLVVAKTSICFCWFHKGILQPVLEEAGEQSYMILPWSSLFVHTSWPNYIGSLTIASNKAKCICPLDCF